MKKTLLIIVLAALCLNFAAQAQDKPTNLTALKIGDQVPDITINNIINYKDKEGKLVTTAKISDFKGKFLILDFWATWCTPCIAMIPKMDSLQKEFAGKVQFLPVAYQSQHDIQVFVNKLQSQQHTTYELSDVVEDIQLAALFPHQLLPHYVWIDNKGTVKAITGLEAINAENISELIKKNSLAVKAKIDVQDHYDRSKPLFFNPEAQNNLLMRTQMTGYIEGIGRGLYKDIGISNNASFQRITARNLTIPDLFRLAYEKETKETLLEVKDPNKLESTVKTSDEYLDWLKKGHAYCFEMIVPTNMQAKAFTWMQNQLKDYFDSYHVELEKRKVKCLALVRTSNIDKIHTAGGKPAAKIDGFGCTLTSCYLYVLISRLQVSLQKIPLPLIDETGYTEMADLSMIADMSNIAQINIGLAKYDLKFIEKEAMIEMLVIKDR